MDDKPIEAGQSSAIEAIDAEHFGPTPPEPYLTNPCYYAALKIAAVHNLPVMPVNGKAPGYLSWNTEASTDPDKITQLFRENPRATNVGIKTGNEHFVVDVDVDNGGFESLAALEAANGKLPVTLTTITGGGGRHLHFLKPKGYSKQKIVTAACVLGEGLDIRGDANGHVVSPPSKHPDTGNTYEWVDFNTKIATAPEWLMKMLVGVERYTRREAKKIHTPDGSDKLTNSELTPLLIRMSGMVKRIHKYNDDQLIRIMHRYAQIKAIDPDHYTYEYVAGKCRWAINKDFEDNGPQEAESESVSTEAEGESVEDIPTEVKAADPHYFNTLDLTAKGLPRKTIQNACIVLSSAPKWFGGFAYDEFKKRPFIARNLSVNLKQNDPIDDRAILFVRHDVNVEVGEDFGKKLTDEALMKVAHEHTFHPVRDYFASLKWDGVNRLKTWLHRYMGADACILNEAIGTAWMISAVARVMQPGCEVDGALILESDKQGLGKNSAMKALLPDPSWHCELAADLSKVDTHIQLSGCLIVEMAEMKNLRKTEVEVIKGFLTQTSDRYRAPYDAKDGVHLRQNVFIGSSNARQYLKDMTGNRRFWPVRCSAIIAGKWIDRDGLARDRDQLWAEAYHRYGEGESWKIEDDHLRTLLEEVQEQRLEIDPWEELLECFLVDKDETTVSEVLTALEIPAGQTAQHHTTRLSGLLRRLGFDNVRERRGGVKVHVWKRKK